MKTGMERALELIAECKRTKATFLDLGSLRLKEIPEEIKQLDHLKRLDLGNESKNENGKLVPAQGWEDFRTAYRNKNQLRDFSFLQHLTGLTYLDLSYNQITDISFLKDLKGLTKLDLRYNQITDYSFLKDLKGLTKLDLISNQITDISFLKDLKGLTNLDLRSNQITDISFLKDLKGLTNLHLSYNQITDISFLKDLEGLTYLNLRSNQITDISFLEDLKGLTNLDLRNNQIERFPKQLLTLPKLRSFDVSKNPIRDFPSEVYNLSDCLKDARSWVADMEQGGIVNNEMKMILLGNGRVGKTCVVDALVGELYQEGRKSTHAIQIRTWEKELQIEDTGGEMEGQPCKIRIWDFGGQDIYHATHRFFMQSRALFLLVWDWKTEQTPKTESETKKGVFFRNFQLPHWMDYIGTLGKQSPVIVVQNKVDRDKRKPVTDQAYLGQLYQKIAGYEAVSAATGRGFEDLGELIQTTYEEMPELGMRMPRSWYEVREVVFAKINELAEKSKNKKTILPAERYLEYADFVDLCQEKEVGKNSTGSLLRYLHNTGWVFYQKNLFDNRIIIDQAWAIKAVYTLFDRDGVYFDFLEEMNGQFSMKILRNVWRDHSEEEQELFLSFMKNCELCFQINKDDKNPIFIAPQLLPKQKPEEVDDRFEEAATEVLHFVFYHPFLHEGILHRFMVRAGHLAKTKQIWYAGIQFRYQKTTAIIEVVEVDARQFDERDNGRKEVVQIRVTGPKSQGLLSLIRKEFAEIHPDAMKPTEMISLNGKDWVDYRTLMKYRRTKGMEMVVSVSEKGIAIADLEGFVMVEKPFGEVAKVKVAGASEKGIEQKEVGLQDLQVDNKISVKQLRGWVVNGKFKQVIAELQEYAEIEGDTDLLNLVLLQSARYKDFQIREIEGAAATEDLDIMVAKVRKGLLGVIGEIG